MPAASVLPTLQFLLEIQQQPKVDYVHILAVLIISYMLVHQVIDEAMD